MLVLQARKVISWVHSGSQLPGAAHAVTEEAEDGMQYEAAAEEAYRRNLTARVEQVVPQHYAIQPALQSSLPGRLAPAKLCSHPACRWPLQLPRHPTSPGR